MRISTDKNSHYWSANMRGYNTIVDWNGWLLACGIMYACAPPVGAFIIDDWLA